MVSETNLNVATNETTVNVLILVLVEDGLGASKMETISGAFLKS